MVYSFIRELDKLKTANYQLKTMHIGCHISIADVIQNAPERAHDFGCEAMQIFTRSPQGGKAPELTPEIMKEFKLRTKNYEL